MISAFGISGVIYCTLILIGVAIVVFICKKIFSKSKLGVKVQKAKLILIDLDNGEGERNMNATPGRNGSMGLNASMGRSIINDAFLTFYLLDQNDKKIILKMNGDLVRNLKEDEIYWIEYRGKKLIKFNKFVN